MNIDEYFPLLVHWIALALFFCQIILVFRKWYKTSIVFVVILLFLNFHWRIYPVHYGSIGENKSKDILRVMAWNICCADSTGTDDMGGILSAILEQDADVVFLTEYSIAYAPAIDSMMCEHFRFKGGFDNTISGGELYSRFPIDTCRHIGVNEKDCIYKYEVNYNGNRVDINSVHLQSNNLVGDESFYPDSISDRNGIVRYMENYKTAAEIRCEQAELIVRDLSDAPCIVLGDMNDVCGSPCMKVFANTGLRDAWWDGGFGYGATIHEPLPYRIDHVLYGNGLKLKGIKKVSSKGLSDHDALVADLEL